MRRYIEHVQSKEPHERRQHAMRLAGAVTAAVFVVWVTTLGLRLSSSNTEVAADDTADLTAAAAQSTGWGQQNQLVPASSNF